MHIWTDIVTRESFMLLTLLALGSGPAAFLGERFGTAARVAMAPVLGLCLGTCVFTTLIRFTAAYNTYWLLPILALISIAISVGRTLSRHRRRAGSARPSIRTVLRSPGLRDGLALVTVCVVVAAPMSYTLHERHSVGPIGFAVWDADGYTAETDAALHISIRQAAQPLPPNASLTRLIWSSFSQGNQNLDAVPFSANVDALLGLHATDTQGLFLIVFLMAGALGAFAAVRYLAPDPWWAAPLAGILFAGPFFLQLMADGSQAATCGLALILPLAVVGLDTLRDPRAANIVLLALLASGLIALYPLFVPGVAIAAAIVLAIRAGIAWWQGRLDRRALGAAVVRIVGLLGLCVIFNVVSFLRDARYWRGVLHGEYNIVGLPVYHLPYSVLPGWLLQTREFYDLTELGSTTPKELLLGVILPILLVSVIVYGIKRRRNGFILLAVALLFFSMAEYENVAHHCSYCTDRALLPIAPISIALLAIGIAALATAPRLWLKLTALAMAVVVVVAIGQRTREERLRFADQGYFLDGGDAALLSKLPPAAGPLSLEGFGANPASAPGELPLVYLLATERTRERVSLPTEYNDYSGLAYLGGPNPANPQVKPGYRYVLTRFGNVQTGRRLIARTGSLALEERTQPIDAIAISGLAVPALRLDSQGLAGVVAPLHMLLVGGSSHPAWISLRFRTVVPVTVPKQSGVTARVTPGLVVACVRTTGMAPVRRGAIQLAAPLVPGIVPSEPFATAEPAQGVQLVAMTAVEHCSPT